MRRLASPEILEFTHLVSRLSLHPSVHHLEEIVQIVLTPTACRPLSGGGGLEGHSRVPLRTKKNQYNAHQAISESIETYTIVLSKSLEDVSASSVEFRFEVTKIK